MPKPEPFVMYLYAVVSATMIEASCHCGAVRMQVERPQRLTSCNCSFCRRHGAVWAYYDASHVAFMSGAGMTVPYIQGDRTLATHHCPTCGCITIGRACTTKAKPGGSP